MQSLDGASSFVCAPVFWMCGSAALVLAAWLVARWIRYRRLATIADAKLNLPSQQVLSTGKYVGQLGETGVSATELATYGAVTSAEFVWSWMAIDPDLVAAASFASTDSIRNGIDFAWYVHQHYDSLSSAAKEGFLNRLSGYYAEQQVADILSQAGHVVQFAETANQPVWDLVVDGHLVNVKNVIDIGSIKADALAHQGVTYLVPHDAHGIAGENIVHLPGFSHDAVKEAVHEGIGQAHGHAAMEGFGLHIPFITIGFSAYRNIRQVVSSGKELGAATNHFVKESVAKGTGVVVGGKVGGAIGTAICPGVGTAIGAIIGALGGGIGGGAVATWWKCRPLAAAINRLEQALAGYGRSFEARMQAIRDYTDAPIKHMQDAMSQIERVHRRRASSLRYILWPDAYTVLLERSLAVAQRQISEACDRASSVRSIITRARERDDWKPLGLLMATEPNIRNAVGSDADLLQDVVHARANVHSERRKLNPNFDPPKA